MVQNPCFRYAIVYIALKIRVFGVSFTVELIYARFSSLSILTVTVSLDIVSSLSFCIFINSRDREGRGTARYSAIASRFSVSVILG